MGMCVCVHVRLCVRVYGHVCVHMYVCGCVYGHVCMHVCVRQQQALAMPQPRLYTVLKIFLHQACQSLAFEFHLTRVLRIGIEQSPIYRI